MFCDCLVCHSSSHIDKAASLLNIVILLFDKNITTEQERPGAGPVPQDAAGEQELQPGLGDPRPRLREGGQLRARQRRVRQGKSLYVVFLLSCGVIARRIYLFHSIFGRDLV